MSFLQRFQRAQQTQVGNEKFKINLTCNPRRLWGQAQSTATISFYCNKLTKRSKVRITQVNNISIRALNHGLSNTAIAWSSIFLQEDEPPN